MLSLPVRLVWPVIIGMPHTHSGQVFMTLMTNPVKGFG